MEEKAPREPYLIPPHVSDVPLECALLDETFDALDVLELASSDEVGQ